jgi:hypothetical protein
LPRQAPFHVEGEGAADHVDFASVSAQVVPVGADDQVMAAVVAVHVGGTGA